MNAIPEEFQIKTLLNQDTYLVDGELKKWEGQTSAVFSTISSKTNTNQQYGIYSIYGRKRGRQLVPLTLHLITVRAYGPP
jgi:glyceraldehyde-3-phosphate dehydrogenase (NADP+)